MSSGPSLVVRRSRFVAGANAALASIVLVGAVWFLAAPAASGETPWIGAAMVVAIVAFQAWQSLRHLLQPTPVVVVEAGGLTLPQASDAPIPWTAISAVGAARSMTLIGGGRLDIGLAPEVLDRLTLGKRLLGDPIVRMPGIAPGVSVIAHGLDHNATQIQAAIAAHWPPREDAADRA